MPIPLLALALAAAPPPDAAAKPAPHQQIEIGLDNVDLAGAGELQFYGADTAAVAAAMGSASLPIGSTPLGDARITFNYQGRAVGCVPDPHAPQPRAVAELCAEIRKDAQFKRDFGFALPYDTGQLAVSFTARSALNLHVPVAIVPLGRGHDVTLVNTGKLCALEGKPFESWANDAVCLAWNRAGRPGIVPEPTARRAAGAARRGPAVSRAGAQARPAAFRARHAPPPVTTARFAVKLDANVQEIVTGQRLIWRDTEMFYPAVPAEERLPMGSSMGTIDSRVTSDDYPSLALREEIGGVVRVLVGFRRDGEPRSCRPIESSGTAYLDNVTCKVAMRRLRYVFREDAPDYSGLRYYEESFRWMIPR